MSKAFVPRVIFLGNPGVGKSSILHWAKYGKFNERDLATVGVGLTRMQATHNGVEIEYQLLDTAGQELYRSIVPMYFRGVSGAVVMFSVIDKPSFLAVRSWIDELYSRAGKQTMIAIVGNKVDFADTEWAVQTEEAEEFARELRCPIYFTSAASGENVNLLMSHILETIVLPALTGEKDAELESSERGRKCC
jgi:small GTP-binding protein